MGLCLRPRYSYTVLMRTSGNITFKPDLGYTPFHLGCNALSIHPNCGLCVPVTQRLNYRPLPNPRG